MERTLVILKPSAIQRGLIGEVISRFEKKGLVLVGMKMVWLTDKILDEHYLHLQKKPFFQRLKNSMKVCPVLVCCWKGVDVVKVVKTIVGVTNSRDAMLGTIRGDYSMSMQENIVHASDSIEVANVELRRFFDEKELYIYNPLLLQSLYATDEM